MRRVALTSPWESVAALAQRFALQEDDRTRRHVEIVGSLADADLLVVLNRPGPDVGDELPGGLDWILARMEPAMADRPDLWGPWSDPPATGLFHATSAWDWWSDQPPSGLHAPLRHHPVEWHLSLSAEQLRADPPDAGGEPSVLTAVVSERAEDPGHRYRVALVHLLQERWSGSDEFEVRVWGRANPHGFADHRGPLPPHRKDEALLPYAFHLAVENHRMVGYATEKLVDGLLAGCHVFYRGDPLAAVRFGDEALTYLPDDPADAVGVIEERMRQGPSPLADLERVLSGSLLAVVADVVTAVDGPWRPVGASYVNLDRRPDRRAALEQRWRAQGLDRWGVHLRRVPAVDAHDLVDGDPRLAPFRGNDHGDRATFMAVALSHLHVWEAIAAGDEGWSLVLEDDVTFAPEIRYHLGLLGRRLGAMTHEAHLVLLGWTARGPQWSYHDHLAECPIEPVRLLPFTRVAEHSIGACYGYLLTRSMAAELVERVRLEGVRTGIDTWMQRVIAPDRLWVTEPQLMRSEAMVVVGEGDSDIQLDARTVEPPS